MRVLLKAHGVTGARNGWRTVPSLVEASKACRKYIDASDLGASNWRGGLVMDDDGTAVARISYNGRAWALDGSPLPLGGS